MNEIDVYSNIFPNEIGERKVVCSSVYFQGISLVCIVTLFERALLGAVSKSTLRDRETYDSG